MAIGDRDGHIYFNPNDFAQMFRVESSGLELPAIFNEPSGVEPIAGFDIDFSQPYIEISKDVLSLLKTSDYIVALNQSNRRYQVVSKPSSQGDGIYFVQLSFA